MLNLFKKLFKKSKQQNSNTVIVSNVNKVHIFEKDAKEVYVALGIPEERATFLEKIVIDSIFEDLESEHPTKTNIARLISLKVPSFQEYTYALIMYPMLEMMVKSHPLYSITLKMKEQEANKKS